MDGGREFQALVSTSGNARSPSVEQRVDGIREMKQHFDMPAVLTVPYQQCQSINGNREHNNADIGHVPEDDS